MEFEQVFDNVTFKRMDASRKQIYNPGQNKLGH